MTEPSSYTGNQKGRAFHGFAFVIYGMLLVGMLIYAGGMNLLAEPFVQHELNTLQNIIPLVYLPAIVFYFVRVRIYIIALIAACAYDLWFRLNTGLPPIMLLTDHAVWTACVLVTVLFGLLYKGFRFRWWFRLPCRGQRNDYLGG